MSDCLHCASLSENSGAAYTGRWWIDFRSVGNWNDNAQELKSELKLPRLPGIRGIRHASQDGTMNGGNSATHVEWKQLILVVGKKRPRNEHNGLTRKLRDIQLSTFHSSLSPNFESKHQ